jgi:hypothetical protein
MKSSEVLVTVGSMFGGIGLMFLLMISCEQQNKEHLHNRQITTGQPMMVNNSWYKCSPVEIKE